MNIVVSTCEYTFVVTHWIHSMLVACYVLVHWNNIVLIHMKYSRYTSHFIGLVHIFTLYTRCRYWLIHDSCITNTLPDAYFSCYRLAHDDGKCMNCMLQLLHRIDIDCFRFEFSFLFVRVLCQFDFLSMSIYLLILWSWQFAILCKL